MERSALCRRIRPFGHRPRRWHFRSRKIRARCFVLRFFAAFLGLALVPLALFVVMLASIGRWVRARQDPAFFTRAIWAAVAMTFVALALLLADVGTLGGGVIPH